MEPGFYPLALVIPWPPTAVAARHPTGGRGCSDRLVGAEEETVKPKCGDLNATEDHGEEHWKASLNEPMRGCRNRRAATDAGKGDRPVPPCVV